MLKTSRYCKNGECFVLDSPLDEIEITKDGVKVEANDRFTLCHVRNVLVFHIEAVVLEDEGVYTVKGGTTELEDGAVLLKVIALESSDQKRYAGSEILL